MIDLERFVFWPPQTYIFLFNKLYASVRDISKMQILPNFIDINKYMYLI